MCGFVCKLGSCWCWCVVRGVCASSMACVMRGLCLCTVWHLLTLVCHRMTTPSPMGLSLSLWHTFVSLLCQHTVCCQHSAVLAMYNMLVICTIILVVSRDRRRGPILFRDRAAVQQKQQQHPCP